MDSRKMLFACAFLILTIPFAFITSKAAVMLAHIENQVLQIAEIE